MNIEYTDCVDAAYAADLDDDALYPDYSGRGMYGDTCLGIVVDSMDEAMRFAAKLSEVVGDEFLQKTASTDGMGLSMIVYWRSVKVENIVREEVE